MIRGCAAGAGFALILAEPKAGPGAEPMLRVTLPAGQSHRLTSSGKAEFNIASDFLCKAPSHDRFGEFPKGIDLIAGDSVPGKWH